MVAGKKDSRNIWLLKPTGFTSELDVRGGGSKGDPGLSSWVNGKIDKDAGLKGKISSCGYIWFGMSLDSLRQSQCSGEAG